MERYMSINFHKFIKMSRTKRSTSAAYLYFAVKSHYLIANKSKIILSVQHHHAALKSSSFCTLCHNHKCYLLYNNTHYIEYYCFVLISVAN